MRKVTGGNGSDTTAAVLEYLRCGQQFQFATLYLFGEPEDSRSIWVTDWETTLLWSAWGRFQPAVIKRNAVSSKIGFEVSSLQVDWSPLACGFTVDVNTASPYQLAQQGYYDNWPVRVWSAYMPTPGDCDTFGASELFGGRVSDVQVARGNIHFEVTSFLDVVNQNVPTNVIELTNTLAAYQGATPPIDHASVPQFSIETGSTQTSILATETGPNAGHLFDDNELRGGFMFFNPGGTLDGFWRSIYANKTTAGKNEIILYAPLPWPPTPGVDTCYISRAFPVEQVGGEYQGFPFVPSAEQAL